MALYLTDISMLSALSAFTKNQKSLTTTYERLSSGLRINSAKDDPAGLAIADRMTSQINGYIQGSRNTQDGISVAQTAEGALDETKTMLQRIRTLAVQAANGTNTSTDRAALNAEAMSLCAEITRIACRTTYAGSQLLAGAKKGGSLVGESGRIGIQVSGQAGDVLYIDLATAFTLSAMVQDEKIDEGIMTQGEESWYLDISTSAGAQNVLGSIDKIINRVSRKQGELGAIQVRFESVLRNNSTMRNNVEDARSRIRDTDYAEEASNLAQQSILSQLFPMMFKQIAQNRQLILNLLS